MRNIVAYPLEDKEILAYLDRLDAEAQASDFVGSMDGMIINALRQRVTNHPYAPDAIVGYIAPQTTTTETTTASN